MDYFPSYEKQNNSYCSEIMFVVLLVNKTGNTFKHNKESHMEPKMAMLN